MRSERKPMIVRAIDGRYLGHPCFFSIEKERPWQRLSPASKFIQSSCHGFSTQKLKHEMVTGKQSCKLFLSAGLHSPKSVESSGGLCVGAQRSLCRGSDALCRGPALSVSEPGGLCVGARRSLRRARHCLCGGPALFIVSGFGGLCRAPALRSACHQSGPAGPSSDPRTHPAATLAQIRVPPFFQERTPNLTVWGIQRNKYIYIYMVKHTYMYIYTHTTICIYIYYTYMYV